MIPSPARAASRDECAEVIASGAAQWRDAQSVVRRQAREALRGGKVSTQVLDAALDAALWDLDWNKTRRLLQGMPPAGARSLVILPGNVIGPALCAAYCAAIAGAAVELKSSGEESRLAPIIARQFEALGAPLAGTVEAVYWPRGAQSREDSAFGAADYIVAFGENATIADVAARIPTGVKFTAYGESYSIGYVDERSDWEQAAAGAARDICIFDQRGCMSPQTIYVQGDESRVHTFAQLLATALKASSGLLPRAKPASDEAAAAADMLRRLRVTALEPLSHTQDTMILGPDVGGCPQFAVVVQPKGQPTCAGFGRIAALKPCAGTKDVVDLVFAYGRPLDTIGVAGPDGAAELVKAGALRICPIGEMQRPPFGYRPKIDDFLRLAE